MMKFRPVELSGVQSTTPGDVPDDAPARPSSDLPQNNNGPGDTREAGRVARAAFVGTVLEWYDFYLYGLCAALVFGPLFFSAEHPVAGQLGAMVTFAVGFIARPIGGALAGHFGDRLGRKRVLVITLLVMGWSTVLVGLLPTYEQVGLLAPALLVILRILQGAAMGGEWGGAVSMAIEHAPPNRRAFYTSAIAVGPAVGLVLANVVILAVDRLTGEHFTQWGWRIAFISSIALIAVGYYVRRRVQESPMFEASVAHEPPTAPILEVVRSHRATLLKTLLVAGAPGIGAYIVTTYALAYGTKEIGYPRSALLAVGILVALTTIPLIVVFARLADRLGAWRVMVAGCILQTASALALFPLFDTGIIAVAAIICVVVAATSCLGFATVPVILSEAYPTRVRYTGISLSYQLGTITGGGLAPVFATAIFASTGRSWLVGAYMAGMSLIALLCMLRMRATPGRNPR